MATYDGAIIIQTDIDTASYDKGLRSMENSAKSFSSNLTTLFKGVGAAMAGAFTFKEFATMAGTMTDLESRARIASRGLEDTSKIMERLRSIADAAYSPLEATATAFMNNATALNALGMSMEEQLDLADALTNALIVGGAKGEQFEMVMNAINRSLAMGKMSSQELDMILKYGGTVAEALAENLGTTVNGLRQFSAEGKITAKVISESLVGNMQKFRDQAAEMPATIGDAMVRLRNQIMITVNELNKSMGIEQTTVKAIDMLKESLDGIEVPLETALRVGTALFVTLLGGNALTSIANFIRARTAMVQAIVAETQAERLALATKGQSVTASGRYTNELVKQAQTRQAAAAASRAAALLEAETTVIASQATIQATTTKIAFIEATLAEARARIAATAATMEATAASAFLAAEEAKLLRIEGMLVAERANLARANGVLASTQSALAASSARGAVALTGLRSAASGVLAMFGGPWGLALTAAAGGIYYLTTRQTEGEKATKKYSKEIEELRKKYGMLGEDADNAADAIDKVNSKLTIAIESGKKSLETQAVDIQRALQALNVSAFYSDIRRVTGASSEEAHKAAQSLHDALNEMIQAIKDGRRDITPEMLAFDKLLAQVFGGAVPERLAKKTGQLVEDALAMEGTAKNVEKNVNQINNNLQELGNVDWSSMLNSQRSFSEQLISQLTSMGVQVRGLKLIDLTDSIASLQSAQKKFSEAIDAMVAKATTELETLRRTMQEVIASGGTIPPEVLEREAELAAQIVSLNEQKYSALSAQTAAFLAEERLATEQSLNDKKLSIQKEVEIRKKAAEDIVKIMSSQGELSSDVVQAIIDITAASDNLGAAQKDVAQAAIAMARAELQAQAATAALAVVAAATVGDMIALANATLAVAQASAALSNLEQTDFKLPDIKVGGGGGGRRGGGGGGGVNEQKKSLEEIELILARLSGDFEKIKQIEANQELERFIELTKKAGLSSSEAAAKIEEFKEKQGSALNTENLETLISFYDELRLLLPQASEEYNKLNVLLIEQKAQALLAAGAMAELVEKWKELQLLASSQEWQDGMKRGAQAFIDEWGNAAKVAEKTFDTMIQGVQDLASGVIDAIFGDAEFRADKFLKNLAKKFLELALNQAIASVLKAFFPTAHTGGIVGTDVAGAGASGKLVSPFAFMNAKKYHAGGVVGLAASEVPAILKQGEGVFTPAQMKALSPVGGQVELKQKIEVVNPPGVPLQAEVTTTKAADGTLQTAILLKSIEDGMSSRMRRGESKLTPTLESRYGLNSAKGLYTRTGG